MTEKHIFHENKLLVKKSSLAFLAFILIYLFDPLSYGILGNLNINIPTGFIGILISFFLIPYFLFSEKGNAKKRMWIAFILLFPVFSAYLSGRGELHDIYFWVRALGFFVIGYYFLLFLKNFECSAKCFFLAIFFLVITCSFFIFFDDLSENYLRTSNGLMIFSFFVISLSRRKDILLIIAAITLIALYSLGSRFSFFAFAIATSFLFFIKYSFSKKIIVALLSIPFSASIFIWLKHQYEEVSNIHNHRFLRLLFEKNNDTSLQGREELLSKAINIFANNPLVGDYKYYLDQGLSGAYAHNAISFWAEMGVIGITISIFFFVIATKSAFLSYKIIKQSPLYFSFVFLSSITVLLGMLLAKSYVWLSLYFFSGLCYSFLIRLKKDENKTSSHW